MTTTAAPSSAPSAPSPAPSPALPPLARRHAEALRARRSELTTALAEVDGRHRARLRGDLALVRLRATADLTAALRDLRTLSAPWISGPRSSLPAVLGPAIGRVSATLLARARGDADAAVRRAAGRMLGPHPLPGELIPRASTASTARTAAAPAEPAVLAVRELPEPPGRPGRLDALLRAGSGAGAVRLVLVLVAGAPALGLSVAGGRTLLPLAVGLAVAAAVLLARHRRVALDRERWGYWLDTALRDAEAATVSALSALLIDLERRATELLDRTAAERRTALAAELRSLGGPDAP
ncbi:hypothetical protein LWC33_18825 [Pseudonocardia sp. RS11V-5]|uniref:hypothetical protein n=1 Tax=Pseudonocardia terrae TaxID=2905831 RepID=UPI001E360D37|nr:hypothetical protein [Pseudonocardia terrae]MCE3553501.1 hypothetical protein [Pseudonocardia terrae]